jgi:glycosyltransferase involved in cell wall biosynthesis
VLTLSIITVCLNDKHGLEKTIQSVIEQSFTNFEFIIIDGGSTDGSVEIIKKYNSVVSHWISESDSGIYNAMNKGIKASDGEYCLFLNSGDTLYNSQTLEEVFSVNHSEDVLYGNMIIDWKNGKQTLGKMPAKITVKHMIRDTLWHPVSFIKRNLFNKIGIYNEYLGIAGDYDFFIRALLIEKVSTLYLNQTIAIFAFDGISSIESNREKLLNERRQIQLRYFNEKEIEKALTLTPYEKLKSKIRALR